MSFGRGGYSQRQEVLDLQADVVRRFSHTILRSHRCLASLEFHAEGSFTKIPAFQETNIGRSGAVTLYLIIAMFTASR